MADEEKKVEVKVEGEQKVALSDEEIAKLVKDNEELLKQNEELDTTVHKIAAERENYKRGLLKEKGKLPDNEEENLEVTISKILDEKLSGSKESQILREKDEIVKRLLEKNKELTVALKNRGQVSIRTAGGSQDNDNRTVGKEFWTPEQVAYFKKRGLDPNKVQDNYLKIKEKK